jgi:hypothetical protein
MRFDTFESKFPEIQFTDEHFDRPDWIVFSNKVVESFRKQRALSSVFTFNETLHGFSVMLEV